MRHILCVDDPELDWSGQPDHVDFYKIFRNKEAYSSLFYKHRTATGTHVPYGITQYYLPPGRGDIPA